MKNNYNPVSLLKTNVWQNYNPPAGVQSVRLASKCFQPPTTTQVDVEFLPVQWRGAGWRGAYEQRWRWCLCWPEPLFSFPRKQQWCNRPVTRAPQAAASCTEIYNAWWKLHLSLVNIAYYADLFEVNYLSYNNNLHVFIFKHANSHLISFMSIGVKCEGGWRECWCT